VGALDRIVARLRGTGADVEMIGYNRASADLIDRFALYDRTGVERCPLIGRRYFVAMSHRASAISSCLQACMVHAPGDEA
jgi:hypothetical protein